MKNLVVLVSGSGSNLLRILEAIDCEEISNAKVTLVIADRACGALQHADDYEIPHSIIKRGKEFSQELENAIPKNTDLIVLAGFLSILSPEFCEHFQGKIINIHPALLPKFGGKGMWGMHVHQAVIAAKEKESGATVHYVTPEVDEGQIIMQGVVKLSAHETAESLADKVHQIEYRIFPDAIEKLTKK